MIELKTQINIRVSHDINIGIAVTNLINDEHEAVTAGQSTSRIVNLWLEGYGADHKEATA